MGCKCKLKTPFSPLSYTHDVSFEPQISIFPEKIPNFSTFPTKFEIFLENLYKTPVPYSTGPGGAAGPAPARRSLARNTKKMEIEK